AYYISIKNQYKGNTYTLAKRLGSFRKAYDYLVGKGYDGIIVDELGEGYNEYIVFKPEQIKSATDNIGTFDGNNPDIRYMIEVDEDSSKENFGTYDSVKAKEIDKRDRRIKELETQLENAHMQLLYNEGKGIDTDATLKISEEIIKNYSSDISKVKLHRDITAFLRSGLF
ncbi:MAG: hypothetical protein UIL37_00170, partial [Clostridia bacterium]|nr:hypothetical protein [Clostridia bacterium]